MSELKRTKSDPSKSRGFGGINTRTEKPPRLEDLVEVIKYPQKKWLEVRFVGDVWSYAHWWIDIETAKGSISIPKQCVNYDPETDSFDSTIGDPYADIPNKKRRGVRYYCNAIIRDLQQDEPKKQPERTKSEKKTGFKELKSKAWTPVRVVQIPSSLAAKLQGLVDLNRHKSKKGVASYELSHPKYGCNVFIKFDPDTQGTDMYQVQKGDHTPLDEEEIGFLRFKLDGLLTPEPFEVAKREAANLASKAADAEEDEDEDDDFEDKPKKKKSTDKVKSKSSTKSTKSKTPDKVKSKKSKSTDKSSTTKSKDKTKVKDKEKSKSTTKSKSKDKKKRSRDFD